MRSSVRQTSQGPRQAPPHPSAAWRARLLAAQLGIEAGDQLRLIGDRTNGMILSVDPHLQQQHERKEKEAPVPSRERRCARAVPFERETGGVCATGPVRLCRVTGQGTGH